MVTVAETKVRFTPRSSTEEVLDWVLSADVFSRDWEGRSVNVDIREAIIHTVSGLTDDVELDQMDAREDQRPQLETLDKQLRFLSAYYNNYLKGVL